MISPSNVPRRRLISFGPQHISWKRAWTAIPTNGFMEAHRVLKAECSDSDVALAFTN
jgi:hypothetical protein